MGGEGGAVWCANAWPLLASSAGALLFTLEKLKRLGSGGSMFARMKLKGIDGRAPPGVELAA